MINTKFSIKSAGKLYLWFTFATFSFLFVRSVYAQSKFEGTLTYVIHTDQEQTQTMNYSMKGNKVRMDMDIPGVPAGMQPAIIFDNENHMMYTLITQLKSYMEISMDSLADKKNHYEKNEKPVKTGQTKMIAGIKCVEWKIKNDESETTLWNAPNFGDFIFGKENGFFGSGKTPDWAKEMTKNGFFPFEIVNKDANGNVIMTMEVTHVDRKKLDASFFKVPSDYNKMNIPLMKQD